MQIEDLLRKRKIYRHRASRDQAIYDVAGLITEKEARSILKNAIGFVETVKAQIGGKSKP